MKLTGNTILITGGGSGIGRGLAEAFHALKNKVIIAGRREGMLQKVAAANPGMDFVAFDQADANDTRRFAHLIRNRYQTLNILVNNAGIQRIEDLKRTEFSAAEETIQTNLLGPLRLTSLLIDQLLAQPQAAILNVTSALAMLPAAMLPSYCASKAAMHSYTQSLRYQLRDTPVRVVEIVPPWVQTELQGDRGMNPKAMPLAQYITETMQLLEQNPESEEIIVNGAAPMRYAERGDYRSFYEHYNATWINSQTKCF